MKTKEDKNKEEKKKADVFEIAGTLKEIIGKLEDWYIEEIKAPEGASQYYIKKVNNHIEIGYAKCELSC